MELTHATTNRPNHRSPPRPQMPVPLPLDQVWSQGIDQVTRQRILRILGRLAVANLAIQQSLIVNPLPATIPEHHNSPIAAPQGKEAGHD